MKISGKELASEVYQDVQKKLLMLHQKKVVPQLVIVKSSNIDAVNNYISQKIKKGEKVGIEVKVVDMNERDCENRKLIQKKIIGLNKSANIHGIIFQKPSNSQIDEAIEELIDTQKDVDGFLENSFHKPPVYRGVIKVLEKIFNLEGDEFIAYLKTKKVVLIGKGKTGGQTIISGLKTEGFNREQLTIIDSKTSEVKKKEYLINADIIISAVGKLNPVDLNLFSKESILIDIGVHFDERNKIRGDFNEEDIQDRVGYYTTTPGGIGALTVAYLMDNVVNAAIHTIIN
ncbi:hypothetical protein COZ40_02505 [Candidatus Roizmanbacteria bacterium CG_4_10_14_3_um_filter_39_13]|uniref:Methenyltetrahydrofolate cyclohydrolase n=2 Tax=Candidatus Roizmaniibacteriota TaxID=1752723 RepID=A0A2M7LKI6_9BACT|nr:MAG: hypothetical protein COZ40_02505 [Candidatus Roizmanbacteria bacterium CG_4_10_14_3_um_filter_39_13]